MIEKYVYQYVFPVSLLLFNALGRITHLKSNLFILLCEEVEIHWNAEQLFTQIVCTCTLANASESRKPPYHTYVEWLCLYTIYTINHWVSCESHTIDQSKTIANPYYTRSYVVGDFYCIVAAQRIETYTRTRMTIEKHAVNSKSGDMKRTANVYIRLFHRWTLLLDFSLILKCLNKVEVSGNKNQNQKISAWRFEFCSGRKYLNCIIRAVGFYPNFLLNEAICLCKIWYYNNRANKKTYYNLSKNIFQPVHQLNTIFKIW